MERQDKDGAMARKSMVFALLCALWVAAATPALASQPGSWKYHNGRWWYPHADHSYTVSDFEQIGAHTYYFDASGYMVTGWKKVGGYWYCFDGNGCMLKDTVVDGWKLDGQGRYVQNRPAVKQGWKREGAKWWYQNADGSYPKNQFKAIDGQTFYFNGSGYMVTGWQKIDSYWYCFDGNGCMLKDTTVGGWKLDEHGRYVESRPALKPGWNKENGKWRYRKTDGSYIKAAFANIQGNICYFNDAGYMVTGWQKIDSYWYYFNSNGYMLKNTTVDGWTLDDQGRYVEPSKNAGTWKKTDGKWWYQRKDGTYPKSTFQDIGNYTYYFNAQGYLETGWIHVGDQWYYADGEGRQVHGGWLKIDGKEYYFNKDGVLQTNRFIGGTYVDKDGHIVPYAIPIDTGNKTYTVVQGRPITQEASDILSQLNAYRKSQGLSQLEEDGTMSTMAGVRAVECFVSLSHRRPNGSQGLSVTKGRDCPQAAAEIFGQLGSGKTEASQFLDQWKASAELNKELLGDYKTCGVSVMYDLFNQKTYAVVIFSAEAPKA